MLWIQTAAGVVNWQFKCSLIDPALLYFRFRGFENKIFSDFLDYLSDNPLKDVAFLIFCRRSSFSLDGVCAV